jgi:hypothetical protein
MHYTLIGQIKDEFKANQTHFPKIKRARDKSPRSICNTMKIPLILDDLVTATFFGCLDVFFGQF